MAAGTQSNPQTIGALANPIEETWLEIVARQVEALKFGSVQITVHEGRIVQIETSVKVRFDKPDRRSI